MEQRSTAAIQFSSKRASTCSANSVQRQRSKSRSGAQGPWVKSCRTTRPGSSAALTARGWPSTPSTSNPYSSNQARFVPMPQPMSSTERTPY